MNDIIWVKLISNNEQEFNVDMRIIKLCAKFNEDLASHSK